jgi:hypothetical protein
MFGVVVVRQTYTIYRYLKMYANVIYIGYWTTLRNYVVLR